MGRSPGKTNVVEPPASLIGRDEALSMLAAHFDGPTRLVTLVGPGGVGKTRLATRFVLDHASTYTEHGGGGAWLVDLTGARSMMEVCGAIAAALDIQLDPATSERGMIRDLGHRIARRRRTLIVLDNCEHLTRDVGVALTEWIFAAPHASFLVTSRVALGIPPEQLHPLAGLGGDEGCELFVRCARQVHPALAVGLEDREAIAKIVQRVDGLPLAIELAAARARVLSPVQLCDRLALGLLVRPGDPSRHGSMRATILDSVGSLDPEARRFFGCCAVFHGGFAVEAAEAVLALDGIDVLRSLETLTDHSLLRTFTPDAGRRRFALFETIREVATEQLDEDGDRAELAKRHARYFAELGRRLVERARIHGDQQALPTLALERDNLVAAHAHAIAVHDGALARTLVLALDPLLARRGQCRLRLRLLDATLEEDDTGDDTLAAVFLARGQVHRELGTLDGARADFERGRTLAEQIDDRPLLALAELGIGELVEVGGATEDARARYVRALEHLRDDRDAQSIAHAGDAHAQLGHALRREGQLERAEDHLTRAEALYRAVGRREGLGAMAYETAVIALFRGQLELSERRFEEGLAHARELGSRQLEAAITSALGVLAQERGELDTAINLHTSAVRVFRELGNRHREGSALYYLATTYLERRELVEALAVLDQAAVAIQPVGAHRYVALIEGARGAAYALADRSAEATRALDRADAAAESCQSERSLLATLAIHRLQLSSLDAEARRAAGRELVAAAPGDDPRLAQRVLEVRDRARSRAAWIIRAEGRGFCPPGAEDHVDLSRRKPLCRLLSALARRRVDAPGDSLGLDDLLAAAWPDEHIAQIAAINRVHVALSTLRKLGLRDLLQRDERGYLLDPSVAVDVE